MIANDHELHVTLERIVQFQAQVARLRQVKAHPANYHGKAYTHLAGSQTPGIHGNIVGRTREALHLAGAIAPRPAG